jgi:hypothetical protein
MGHVRATNISAGRARRGRVPVPSSPAAQIFNALAALIVVSSADYALSYAIANARTYSWVIAINLALVAMALCVPLMYRVHEIVAGLNTGTEVHSSGRPSGPARARFRHIAKFDYRSRGCLFQSQA